MNSEIIMYKTDDDLTKIETTFDGDTVCLSIDQMAELFQRDKFTISRHIKNIFKEGELIRNLVVVNFATTKELYLDDVYKVEKDYIKTLEDMEMKLPGEIDKK